MPQPPHVSLRQPKPPKVEVRNPRYEGATPLMVAKALLQRPKKTDQEDGEPTDDGADSRT